MMHQFNTDLEKKNIFDLIAPFLFIGHRSAADQCTPLTMLIAQVINLSKIRFGQNKSLLEIRHKIHATRPQL
jgi:hypothetical protein